MTRTGIATVLSLGAGVQSTTLLLMAEHGEVTRPVEAIFADTGWEPPAVYTHLAWLRTQTSIPITRVSLGNLRKAAIDGDPRSWMPLYVVNKDGGKGILRRQCTTHYKLRPIRRRVRQIWQELGVKHIEQQIGISYDESVERMRQSEVGYITNAYPLVDRRVTRDGCEAWLAAHGYPKPGKSSCIGCPYRTDWRDMKANRPAEWADAVAFDEEIRSSGSRLLGKVFLHQSRVPLVDVDLSTEQDRGQLSFLDECMGMCGV